MRFALLGDHPDGLDMARALALSGRHEIAVYSGPASGLLVLQRYGLKPTAVGDLEEVLADPAIEAVIVAGEPSVRGVQLRRALQSAHHVLCVHPAGESPDVGHEADMLRDEFHCVLLPLLPESLHPGICRLAEILAGSTSDDRIGTKRVSDGQVQPVFRPSASACHLFVERWSTEGILLQAVAKASFIGWDTLRRLGGEIGELYLLAASDEPGEEGPMLLSGRFVHGGLFQETFLPSRADNRLSITLLTSLGRADLLFPDGWPGPSRLTHRDAAGQVQEENWPADDPWSRLVECFEAELSVGRDAQRSATPVSRPTVSWRDAIWALELDDAARRSLRNRRAIPLDLVEATEEASFKGSMTLLGCGLLWLVLGLTIAAIWIPWAGWFILPALGGFLLLQLLRNVVRDRGDMNSGESSCRDAEAKDGAP